MQHPGTWYLPWGVPLQKMLVPFNHPSAVAAYPQQQTTPGQCHQIQTQAHNTTGINQQTSHQSQVPAVSAASSVVNHQQHQHYQNAAAAAALATAAQPQATQNYAQIHSVTAAALQHHTNSAAAAAALHHHTQLHQQHQQAPPSVTGHGHPHQHPQTIHPAAAAAMFTPLSLRTFITAPSAHNHLGLAAAAAAAAQQPLTPTSAAVAQAVPGHYHHTHQQQQSLHQQSPHFNQHTSPPPPPLPQGTAVTNQTQSQLAAMNINVGVAVAAAMRQSNSGNVLMPLKKVLLQTDRDKLKLANPEKRKAEENDLSKDLKKAKLETKALKAKRPGFTDERYHETSYYIENGLRKVYPYYFTFTTFTKGRWVGEKILDVFAREFRAHPAEEYERCIKAGTLTVNYEKVPTDYRLKHNDLLANVVHRHEVPVTSQPITIVHMDDDIVVVNKPASIPVHPCGRYRHNTVVFILAKEYNLKNLRTIHRLDRLTSGLLLFGRSPKKARQMEHQIRNRQVRKEYICRVDGEFPDGTIECKEPIEVVSYKIGVCKVSPKGKECTTSFQKLGYNGKTSVVLCKPLTGRMHQIRVHLQYLGYPVVNDPLYNHEVFGPNKGKGGDIGGKSDEQLVKDLINIHNAENWLGIDGDSELSLFKSIRSDTEDSPNGCVKGNTISDDESESVSRESSPCSESPRPISIRSESPHDVLQQNITNNNSHNHHHQKNITTNNNNNTNNNNTTTIISSLVGTTSNSTSVGTLTTGNPITQISNIMHQTTNLGGNCYNQNLNTTSLALESKVKVTVATQTGHESPDLTFNSDKMTTDKHCYECKVRYRDPKPQDLVMYLHAWKYKGPGWEYETDLPNWAKIEWVDPTFE